MSCIVMMYVRDGDGGDVSTGERMTELSRVLMDVFRTVASAHGLSATVRSHSI